MSATISPRLHPGFRGRRGPKVFRKVLGTATASRRIRLRRDSHLRDRGPRSHPPAAPTGSGPRTWASSRAQVRRPRPPSAPLTFFILVSRSMLGVGGAQSRVRDLRCGNSGAAATATHAAPSNFRSPVRLRLGPGTKRPWQPMAAGQRRIAANQRAPHAPSRPERR